MTGSENKSDKDKFVQSINTDTNKSGNSLEFTGIKPKKQENHRTVISEGNLFKTKISEVRTESD